MAKWGIYRNSQSADSDPYTEIRTGYTKIEDGAVSFYNSSAWNPEAAFSLREFYIVKLED